MQIGIVEPRCFSRKAIELLKTLGEVSFYTENNSLDEFLDKKEIIFVRLKYFLDSSILKFGKELKFICTPTTGLNHIDLEYTDKRDIQIISLKGEVEFLSDIRATSEHTFGLILALLRNYQKLSFLSEKKFNRDYFTGYEIFGNNIGIIGFGRVGKLLAKYISAFDGICFYYDRDSSIGSVFGAKKTNSIEDLISKSDIVVLCASYDDENINLISSKHIDLLKNKFFVNTSRGELVNEEYLLCKIKERHFKGVAIDVIQNEAKDQSNLNAFLDTRGSVNFIFTPHMAGATFTSMNRTEEFIAQKLVRFISN